MERFFVAKSILLVSAISFINLGVGVANRDWQKSLTVRRYVQGDQNSRAVVFRDQSPQGNMATSQLDTFWKVILCLTPLKIVVATMLHRRSPQQPLVIHKSVTEQAAVSHETHFFSGPDVMWQAILAFVAAACIVALVGVALQLTSPAAPSNVKVRDRPSRSKRSQRRSAKNIRKHTVNLPVLSTTTATASFSKTEESVCKEKIVHRPGAARRMRLLHLQQENANPTNVPVPMVDESEHCRAGCMSFSTMHIVNGSCPVAPESCKVNEVDGSAENAQATVQ